VSDTWHKNSLAIQKIIVKADVVKIFKHQLRTNKHGVLMVAELGINLQNCIASRSPLLDITGLMVEH